MAGWPYVTSRWRKLRLAKLSESPVCVICERRGLTVEADVVDHVQPIRQGGDPFPAMDGLMSLCARCHNEKSSGFDRQHGNATGRRFKGCDAEGNPVDPGDGWWDRGASSSLDAKEGHTDVVHGKTVS